MTDPALPSRPSTRRLPRARPRSFPLLLLLLGFNGPPNPARSEIPAPVTLFTFDQADEAQWVVVNDGVMGGRSSGFVAVESGSLRFTGTLVTHAAPAPR